MSTLAIIKLNVLVVIEEGHAFASLNTVHVEAFGCVVLEVPYIIVALPGTFYMVEFVDIVYSIPVQLMASCWGCFEEAYIVATRVFSLECI